MRKMDNLTHTVGTLRAKRESSSAREAGGLFNVSRASPSANSLGRVRNPPHPIFRKRKAEATPLPLNVNVLYLN